MARTAVLTAMSLFAFHVAAQPSGCTLSVAGEHQCNSGGPGVRRSPNGELIFDDTDLFQRRSDGTWRVRRMLYRPPPRKTQR
jgi:hypothetical protein